MRAVISLMTAATRHLGACVWLGAALVGGPAHAVAAGSLHCDLADASLHAKLAGAWTEELSWHGRAIGCEGMPRADGGIRLRFTGSGRQGDLSILFGIPDLKEGKGGQALPVNVTIISSDGRVFGTRGTDRCTLDKLSQQPLASTVKARRWRVDARGFCLEPARAVNANSDLLLTTFELVGLVVFDDDGAGAALP